MIYNFFIASGITLMIFIITKLIQNYKKFVVYQKIRDLILKKSSQYLNKVPAKYVDIQALKEYLFAELKQETLEKWVEDISISWDAKDRLAFAFRLRFPPLNPTYRFVIGMRDVEDLSAYFELMMDPKNRRK